MRPLCQFFLYLFVYLYVSLQSFNLLLHFIVFKQKLLSLLALVLELSGQLVILKYCQPRRRLELLIVECQEIGLGFLYFEKHLFSQLLGRLDLLPLFFTKFELLIFDLLIQGLLKLSELFIILSLLLFIVL